MQPTSGSATVAGVQLHDLPHVHQQRGDLSVGEFGRTVPFVPQRYFLVYGVPAGEIRGQHAHRECKQFLICVAGQVAVSVDDGTHREDFLLDRPNTGLYIPPRVWGVQKDYSTSAVLLVFTSHFYDPADYISDYQAFIDHVRGAG